MKIASLTESIEFAFVSNSKKRERFGNIDLISIGFKGRRSTRVINYL